MRILLILAILMITGCESSKREQPAQEQTVAYEDLPGYEPALKFQGNTSVAYDLYMDSLQEEYLKLDKGAFPVTATLMAKHLQVYSEKKQTEKESNTKPTKHIEWKPAEVSEDDVK
ncbi:MAG: hypothetical protein NTX81_03315 [Candidatus Bathyarchaeota archaeon]|nr:hypothetical protein [Candidatus Bathyarchaeota archaeon]